MPSAAVASLMHRLCCSLNVRCESIHTPSHRVACFLNRMTPSLILIFAVTSGWGCFQWPRLCVISAAIIFAFWVCSRCLLAHPMLVVAHLSYIVMTILASLSVATQPRPSRTYSSVVNRPVRRPGTVVPSEFLPGRTGRRKSVCPVRAYK